MTEVEQEFERGTRKSTGRNPRSRHGYETMARYCNEARSLLLPSARGNQDLLKAAFKLGAAQRIALARHDQATVASILASLGKAISDYVTEDTDLAKARAASLLEEAAGQYRELDNMRTAAIVYTNAASVILDQSRIRDSDLQNAATFLDFSFEHKEENSLDWGYSQFTAGRLGCQMAYRQHGADRVRMLAEAVTNILDGLRLLRAHQGDTPVGGIAELGRVVLELIDADRHAQTGALILAHIDDLPASLYNRASNAPESIAGLLQSNPVAIGVDQTPVWLDLDASISLSPQHVTMLEEVARELERLLDVSSERHQLAHGRWYRARIEFLLHRSRTTLQGLISALHDFDTDPERYFGCAYFIIKNGQDLFEPETEVPVLRAAVSAFNRVSTARSSERLEPFLRSQPVQMRFIAGQLSEYGLWDEAIETLEASRALIHELTDTPDLPSHDATAHRGPSWVYLNHSPVATYIAVAREEWDRARGIRLNALAGRNLVQLTNSFADSAPGLVTVQTTGMSAHLETAVVATLESLRAVAEQICRLAPAASGICLVACGLFSQLPVSAAVLDHPDYRHPFISVVSSRHATSSSTSRLILDDRFSYHGVSAMNPPHASQLRYPDAEVSAVQEILRTAGLHADTKHEACVQDLTTAARTSSVVHFSGHSSVDHLDPRRSALILTDADVTVQSMSGWKRTDPGAFLAAFSSCSSGVPSTLVLGDEAISVNAAALKAGFAFSVGSLWQVNDLAGMAFMVRFFQEVAVLEALGAEELSSRLRTVQLWMRSVTVQELERFLHEHGVRWAPPATAPLDARPLQSARYWAAFYLSSRTM
ncbi:hypothetical protein BOX37_23660 [Nocardia mangyaensis]|uniref:CHAT domain-containing protein n=1 Tax=Nocardia mangyaensis TaxID=2213200 RepID=A0A1J0VWM5_9NOCA|nr:CHAT domain-containing protein [Nocardia mangyaensis]APE36430.1 hypothetical protein BOX37_23660 [Nocardia mangyaensis]